MKCGWDPYGRSNDVTHLIKECAGLLAKLHWSDCSMPIWGICGIWSSCQRNNWNNNPRLAAKMFHEWGPLLHWADMATRSLANHLGRQPLIQIENQVASSCTWHEYLLTLLTTVSAGMAQFSLSLPDLQLRCPSLRNAYWLANPLLT